MYENMRFFDHNGIERSVVDILEENKRLKQAYEILKEDNDRLHGIVTTTAERHPDHLIIPLNKE